MGGVVRQRGVAILAYLIAGGIVLAMLGGMVYKVRQSGYDKAVTEYQPKIDAAQQQISALGEQIGVQNRAVQALAAESAAKLKRAQDALKAGQGAAQAARSEAERLKVLAGQPQAPSACPAQAAVEEVRKGLRQP